jgi:hypothetical protein
MNKNIILIFIFLSSVFGVYSQETGITLSSAVNLASPELDESSGLEYCRGKLWTHKDSGGDAKLYAVDPTSGSIVQTITLDGITNVDWEDLAADGYYLYIADTGNNANGARTDLVIYKINLDDIPLTGNATILSGKIEAIRFYYPEQGENLASTGSNNTAYDCEAILIRNDIIHLFTKDWKSESDGSYKTTEYLLPNVPHPSGGKYPAKKFKEHSTGFLVTGADNAGVNEIVLVGYQSTGFGNHYALVYSGFQGDDIYSTGTNFPLGSAILSNMGQAEAICFGEDPFTGYISNEKISGSYTYLTLFNVTLNYPATIRSFSISYPAADVTKITTGTAGGGIQGSIRYNSQRKHLEGFNGLYWIPLDIEK